MFNSASFIVAAFAELIPVVVGRDSRSAECLLLLLALVDLVVYFFNLHLKFPFTFFNFIYAHLNQQTMIVHADLLVDELAPS